MIRNFWAHENIDSKSMHTLYATSIRAAIGTDHMVSRNRKGQQRSALLTRYRLAVHIDHKATGFTHDLLGIRHGMNLRAAAAAQVFVCWLWLDLVIFGSQPVELQESFTIFRR